MIAAAPDTNECNNALYIALCESIKEGAAIIRVADKKFLYCNQSFLRLFGIDSISNVDIEFFRKLRRNQLSDEGIASREQIIDAKGHFSELVEYTPVSGNPFFGEVNVRKFNCGDLCFYVLTVAPIDKAFFELAALGILMVNTDGVVVTVNPYILKQFGYAKNELIGKKIEVLIPARFHHSHIGLREAFIKKRSDGEIGHGKDLFARKKDGTEFPVEISLGHYPSDGDKYVIAFVSDISARKNAEADARKMHEQLESLVEQRTHALQKTLEQLEQYGNELKKVNLFQKALLDNAGAIIVSVDANGIIQTFNPEAERNLGYSAAEVTGKCTPLLFHDPELMKSTALALSRESQREVPVSMDIFFDKVRNGQQNEGEWSYVRKDGSKFPVRLKITAMKDEAGTIKGFMGVAFDISATKKIEQELNQALQKEKDLGELKSRFVTMASHEFRTPLSTVLSSAYLIEKYCSAEDQSKREVHLQRIVASVSMLTDILNDFLSVGKIEEGKIQVRFSKFNIKELITTVIDAIENTLKTGQRIVYTHSGEEDAELDASLLKHVILNLTSNASKFSCEDCPIEICSSITGQQTQIIVKDHGIGIAPADQQHLMERFFRGTNAGNIQGTGLGLHIVAKYVELMNGTVRCESELDKGTGFIVTFNHKKS